MRLFSISILLVLLSACQSGQNKSTEERARLIHDRVLTLDSHTDTPLRFTRSDFNLAEKHDPYETRSKLDFPRMKEGGLDAVFMAAFVGQGTRNDTSNKKAKERLLMIMDSIHAQLGRHTAIAGIAYKPEDAYRLEKEGKRAVFIGIENGYPLGSNIHNVAAFYERGARYITLCHTRNNELCDSSTDSTEHNGLSNFGIEVVKEMNRLGMLIDVSHISDSSFYDVLQVSTTPVIASHSNARSICNSPRNLNDHMLQKLAENGGVVQVCVLSSYVKEMGPQPERDSAFNAIRAKFNHFEDLSDEEMERARKEWYETDRKFPRKLATVSDFVDHIDHIVKVAGIEHVGIGTDFDGGGALQDCYDVSQMGNITLELVKRGYSADEIRKIWGGNFMRVFREVNQEAKKI
ncbi:MAG: dipeptidase [Bacteroidota bacterium]|nr:dipeptidase [Bacteroidota bacterium]